jgi:hypothetical protein
VLQYSEQEFQQKLSCIYPNLMTHTSMQSRHPSTIKIDDFVLSGILNIGRLCFIEINVGSLCEPLCNQPRFIFYHLIVFISFSNEHPFESSRKDSGRCSYYFSEHLCLLKRVKLSLNYSFHLFQSKHPLHSVMVLGSGSTRKLSAMMVEKYGLTIVVLRSYTSPELV